MAFSRPIVIGRITPNFHLSLLPLPRIPKAVKWVVCLTHLVRPVIESRYFQRQHNNCKMEEIDLTVVNLIWHHPTSPNVPHRTKVNTLYFTNISNLRNILRHHNKISLGRCSNDHNHNRKVNPVGLRPLKLHRVQLSSNFLVMEAGCLRYRNLLDSLEARNNPREYPSLLDLLSNLQLLVHHQYRLRCLLQIAALLLDSLEACLDRRE